MGGKLLRTLKNVLGWSTAAPLDLPAVEKYVSEERIAEIRTKLVRTAREELILDQADSQVEGEIAHTVSVESRDDHPFFIKPDGTVHEPRVSSILLGDYDRVFWVNLVIACDGPDVLQAAGTAPLPRSFGKLDNTRNDLTAFRRYYTPTRIGDPGLVFPDRVGRSPGYFDHTEMLENPTTEQVDLAIARLREWITVNSTDPEFVSVQINFMFAGHGYANPNGDSGIVISDGPLSSATLGEKILGIVPAAATPGSPNRLDLYLDCCHSGAIAKDLCHTVSSKQERMPEAYKSKLGFGKVYCSCLDDEISLEVSKLGHGLFSFAFLHEFSRKIPEGAAEANIGLRDVGWYSNRQQHPFLVTFIRSHASSNTEASLKHFQFMFPSLRLLSESRLIELSSEAWNRAMKDTIASTKPVNGEYILNPVGLVVSACRLLRDSCLAKEEEIRKRPSIRKAFSRTELKEREVLHW